MGKQSEDEYNQGLEGSKSLNDSEDQKDLSTEKTDEALEIVDESSNSDSESIEDLSSVDDEKEA